MQFHQTSATELNSDMNKLIFGIQDNANGVSLVGTWGQAHTNASSYMRTEGIGVLQRSIKAFLDGKVQHHAFVNSSSHNGLLSTNGAALNMLKFIAASASPHICHRQVSHAAKIGVLKQNTLATFCPAARRTLQIRKVPRGANSRAKLDDNETLSTKSTMQDMLVSPAVLMDTEDQVAAPEPAPSDNVNAKPRKRRKRSSD
mgnify:CR=1 FL=1